MNNKVIYIIIIIITNKTADVRFSSFLLDSLSKTKRLFFTQLTWKKPTYFKDKFYRKIELS